jgi:hypothetical protein
VKRARVSVAPTLVFCCTLLLLLPLRATAETQPKTLSKKELKVLLATAKTAADHQRIAAFYRQEFQRLTARARYHEEMAAIYEKNPLSFEGKFPYGTVGLSHCRQFSQHYRAQARQAESLAIRHEEMARGADRDQR